MHIFILLERDSRTGEALGPLGNRLARQHQTTLADRLLTGPVAEIALRLGLIQSPDQLDEIDFGALAPALDLALYGDTEDGIPRAGAYARELLAQASPAPDLVLVPNEKLSALGVLFRFRRSTSRPLPSSQARTL